MDLLPCSLLKVRCWRLAHLVLLPGVLPFLVPLYKAHHMLSPTSLGASLALLCPSCAKDCLCGRGSASPFMLHVYACVCSFQTCSSHRGVPTLYLSSAHSYFFPSSPHQPAYPYVSSAFLPLEELCVFLLPRVY